MSSIVSANVTFQGSITSSGKVGIGTTSPGTTLQVYSTGTTTPLNVVTASNTVYAFYTTANQGIGTGVGATQPQIQTYQPVGGNNVYLNLFGRRQTAGTDWTGVAQRIQHQVDATPMGYMDFNPSVNSQGLAFGNGTTEYVRMSSAGLVGIGTANPQNTLHVQGSTLVTNPTTYNTNGSSGWYNLGLWDCTANQNAGTHLKLRILGCYGYNGGNVNGSQAGGETTIYLTNLNNANTGTVNVDGWWKHEGGYSMFTSVKVAQNGSSRFQYYIWANIQGNTNHALNAETSAGTIWTSQLTSGSDPGANSATVQLIVLNTAAIGTSVGIGTTNPTGGLLDVYGGNTRTLATSDATFITESTGDNFSFINFRVNTSGTAKYARLTLKNTAGSNQFWICANNSWTTGVYLVQDGINWTSSSDSRIKNIIEPISNACSKVDQINPVIYSLKSDETNKRRVGVIAQDVYAVLPEAVDSTPESGQMMGVQYTDLVPLALAAIKELSAENTALKTQMTALEARLAALESARN